VHETVPWATAGHDVEQPPQWVGSDEVSTQEEPQRVFAQVVVQAGADPDAVVHTVPAGQLVVHDPQWVASFSAVSHPSVGSPLQSSKPAAHDPCGTTHWPPPQLVGPLTFARFVQSLSHAPHERGSLAEVHVPASPQGIAPLGQAHAPHWQEASQVCVPPLVQAWVAPDEQTPSPPQALHPDQLPLTHVRVCVPHLPQVCAAGPEHDETMGPPLGGVGSGAGVATEDHGPQGGISDASVLHAVLTTNVPA
jgi:hypothetical protein